eukprot:TRINITY_DN90504_c0_g1_i1.p1 TRINITY_DN90504_c0_g1~~TRINITY_DN90504_c0_g1_i1.p1  ORF type:complete len:450 (-),score=118.87 TRINITY_DN90504_c0_g1_i1:8-1357(-)
MAKSPAAGWRTFFMLLASLGIQVCASVHAAMEPTDAPNAHAELTKGLVRTRKPARQRLSSAASPSSLSEVDVQAVGSFIRTRKKKGGQQRNQSLSQGAAAAPTRVLYALETSQHSLPRLQACLQTWAAHLEASQLIFIGFQPPNANNNTAGPPHWQRWDTTPTCPDSHDGGACKDALAQVDATDAEADWLVVLGDDNYVVTKDLEMALSQKDPSEPVIYAITGCGCQYGCKAGLCGGGGQIFSKAALAALTKSGKQAFLEAHGTAAKKADMYGDVATCLVAEQSAVRISNELLGLHAWRMNQQELMKAAAETTVPPLTFHYVDPPLMHLIHTYFEQHRMASFLKNGNPVTWLGNSEESNLEELVRGDSAAAGKVRAYLQRRAEYVLEENDRRQARRGQLNNVSMAAEDPPARSVSMVAEDKPARAVVAVQGDSAEVWPLRGSVHQPSRL